jgi:Fe2+ transport system protein FeoA
VPATHQKGVLRQVGLKCSLLAGQERRLESLGFLEGRELEEHVAGALHGEIEDDVTAQCVVLLVGV